MSMCVCVSSVIPPFISDLCLKFYKTAAGLIIYLRG